MGEKRNMVLRGGDKPPPYAAQFQTLKAKVDDIASPGKVDRRKAGRIRDTRRGTRQAPQDFSKRDCLF